MKSGMLLAAFCVASSGFAVLQPLDLQQKIDCASISRRRCGDVEPGEWRSAPLCSKATSRFRLERGATLFGQNRHRA